MLKKLKVADVTLEIDLKYNKTIRQSKDYEAEFDKTNISIHIPDEDYAAFKNEAPYLSDEDIEYIYTGAAFYEALLHFNGFMLHSSGVVVDNYAYLFSADPGTGKSTHTDLWVKYFGNDRAKIINDDKPAIRMINDKIYVYGTPWSGKTDQNINMKVPLGAIVFLERSEDNWVKEIEPKEAIPLILQQTIRPREPEVMIKLLDMLDIVLRRVKLYRLGCNISEEAVKVSYNGIKAEDQKNEN
mgnify:CR=1 FL=1